MQQITVETPKKPKAYRKPEPPPEGWSSHVEEPAQEHRFKYRVRLMVFTHPSKGYRLLPFLTKRVKKEIVTARGTITVFEDNDMLPHNPFAASMPAIAFVGEDVTASMFETLVEYAKRQASKHKEIYREDTSQYRNDPSRVVLLSDCVAKVKARVNEERDALLLLCASVF